MKTRTALVPSEYDECKTLVEHLDLLQRTGKVHLFTHIPNETYTTSWAVKRKNKIMGVRKGFPDYVVVTNKDVFFIEMKRTKDSTTSSEQKEWIEALVGKEVKARVCHGYREAKEFLNL